MSDLGRVLRLDARRTALLLAIPVFAAIGLATAWHAQRPGVAYWDATVIALISSVRLLGPLAAALAALVAVREHRLDYLRGLTPRSSALGPLLDLLLLTVVTLAAYGVVTLVVVTQSLLREESGRPRPLGIAAGAAALTLHVVVGYLAGRLLRHPVAVPVTAAVTALWATLREAGSAWCLLPPSAIGHIELFSGLRGRVLADQTLWSFGLAAALVLGYVLAVTRRALLVLPLAAALCATAVGTLRLHSAESTIFMPAPADQVCRQWPLTICVHPALRDALPDLQDALMPLAVRLSGTPAGFERVEQYSSGGQGMEAWRDGDRPGVIRIQLTDLSPGFERRATAGLRGRLVSERDCADPRRAQSAGYSALVTAWLFDEEPPPLADAETAGRFSAWSENRRRSWLRTHFTDYHRCALNAEDFH